MSQKNRKQKSKEPVTAIAVFNYGRIKGVVRFTEDLKNHDVVLDIDIQGLKHNGLHGFHIHEYGDMSEQCQSMCAHFNPTHKNHGCPGAKERHVGDLGNLRTDSTGRATYQTRDSVIKLTGTRSNIIGRGLVIHADEDDCGLTDHPESLTTGNSGKRIACAVIGYARPAHSCS
jgi:superoxide dismutase, Cu-Zn family